MSKKTLQARKRNLHRIGVVGTGRMGANMARRLHDVGYEISAVYDIDRPAAEALATELKTGAVRTLAEVTRGSDLVLTVVTDDDAQLAVFRSKKDNLLLGAKGKYFLNCATVSPAVHEKVAVMAKAVGAHAMEGCMASSIAQARAGTLYLMCGGERKAFDVLRPVLEQLSDGGKLLRYIGPSGSAAKVKALVNMVMNINTAALAEGLGLGDALGLDLAMLQEVFSQTGAASRVLVTDGEDMVRRDHECYFSAAHAAKDSGIALGLAKRAKVRLPLAEATLSQYRKLVALGLGGLDKSGIAELTFRGRGSKAS